MRAAIYARKSTDQSGIAEDARSVARQIEHARAYAERKGWVVLAEHIYSDDGISGAEFARRPAFMRLMASLKPRAPFDVLVMSEESRLGRESLEVGYCFKQLISAGVRVFLYLEDRERTLDSAIDKIMLSLTSFADEIERERARQRTFDAMQRKARAGHVTGGRVFGYRNVEVQGDADVTGRRPRLHVTREVLEPEADVVRDIFARYARGEGLIAIAKALNAERALSPRPQQGRPSGWAPSSVRCILLRRLYAGELVWNRSRKRTAHGTIHQQPRPESDWIIVAAPSLRIVSEDVWAVVQARFEQNKSAGSGIAFRRGASTAKYLLTGLARCVCGSSIEASSHKSGDRRQFVYGCAANRRRGPEVCPNDIRISMQTVDDAVLGLVESYMLQPSIIGEAVERAVGMIAGDGSEQRRRSLDDEASAITAQLSRLVSALAAGGESAVVLSAIRERETNLAALQQQLAALSAAPLVFNRAKLRRELTTRAADWRKLLRDTPQSGHAALRALIPERLTFSPQVEGDRRFYAISGVGTVGPLISGAIQGLASPPGIESLYHVPLALAEVC